MHTQSLSPRTPLPFARHSGRFLALFLVVFGSACGEEALDPKDPKTVDAFSIWPEPGEPESVAPLVENPWNNGVPASPVAGAGGAPDAPMKEQQSAVRLSGPPAVEAIPPLEVPAPQLSFRAYFEGSGSRKALVIHNDLSLHPVGCVVEIYANGGTEPWRTIDLLDVWRDDGDQVLCTEAIDAFACDATMSASFNGNDALVLVCDDAVLDSLGQVGTDPGAAWKSERAPEVLTKDAFLVTCAHRTPDTDPGDFVTLETWRTTDLLSPAWPAPCDERGVGGAGGTGG